MPGPGTSTVGPTGDPAAGSAAGSAAVRLREGLDGWRRHISRRQSAAAARHWSLITLGAALAGVAAGRLDGSMLVTTIAMTAVPLWVGAVTVVRRRRVSAEDAARQLDALFGFDEQVATAVCCTHAGTSVPGRETDVSAWMVAALIERAATLLAQTGGAPDPRPGPAYGEWAAMAVTAAAVAAVAAVPGSQHAAHATAAGSAGLAGRLPGAVAGLRPAHAGGVIRADAPGPTAGPRSTPAGSAGSAAAGGARPAASATGAHEAPATSGAPASGTPASGTPASPAKAGAPVSSGTAGAGAASGRAVPAPTGGSGQRGTTGAAGATGAAKSVGATGVTGVTRTAGATAGRSPTAQSPVTQRGATRSATAQHATGQHATGQRGTAAHGGPRAGDVAGTQPGSNRTSAHPAQLLPGAGTTVLLIVLPGGDGALAEPAGQGSPGQQPEGDGGTSAAIQTATAPGNDAEYVPPDQNEVPFPDLSLLGRYF